jgi:protein-S-isoprenylcysteine O-methyltransferase Ste14
MIKQTPTRKMWNGLAGAAYFLIQGIFAFWFHTMYGRNSSNQVTPRKGQLMGTIFFATALAFLVFARRGYLDRKAERKENSK